MWDEACTRALNQVADVIDKRLPLMIPVAGEPFHLFVAFHSGMLSGMLCQLVEDHHQPVAVTGRELGAALDGLGEAEQYLVVVHMALWKFAHYT